MLVTELSFPHLQVEREVRLTRELERRRVISERLAADARREPDRQSRPWRPWFRMPRRERRGMDLCPTCPSAA